MTGEDKPPLGHFLKLLEWSVDEAPQEEAQDEAQQEATKEAQEETQEEDAGHGQKL